MALLSKKQVVVRIAIIVSVAEFLIMLLLSLVPHGAGTVTEAMLDALLLAVFSTPAFYFWVIKPFVDARDEALTQISLLALTDPVTKLANRRLIATHLEKFITGSLRHKEFGAVLLADLDGFKQVNDSYGHEAGDALLVETARRLQSVVRAEDVVGRLGGDEFVILLHRLGADEQVARNSALRFATKLIGLISEPFQYNGKTLHVGASIGIRLLGSEALDTEAAISEADVAMYRAKVAGRGRAVFFEK